MELQARQARFRGAGEFEKIEHAFFQDVAADQSDVDLARRHARRKIKGDAIDAIVKKRTLRSARIIGQSRGGIRQQIARIFTDDPRELGRVAAETGGQIGILGD